MANTHEKVFNALKDELVIGPDHHRFQLLRKQCDHYAGQIWEAEDVSTAACTPVSLLFLWPVLAAQKNVTRQAQQLAQKNRSLTHPHILRTYGYFSWRGLEFLSLEHLSGQTLADLFKLKHTSKLTAKQKQGLLTQLANALERYPAPHDFLAPDSVFLNTGGGVKLFGFGWRPLVAPFADSLPTAAQFQRYQPAEAFHSHQPTPRGDVYSLAVIAWELYSGKQAFQDKDGESARFQREFKPASGLGKDQTQALNHALAADPEQRHESPAALIRALFFAPDEPDSEPEIDAKALEQAEASAQTKAQETEAESAPTTERASTDTEVSADTENSVEAEPEFDSESGALGNNIDADSTQPAPKPTDEKPAVAAESTDEADAETQKASRSFNLAAWRPSKKVRLGLGLAATYLLGLVSGVWLALLFYGNQLDTVGAQAVSMMKDNRELRAAFEASEQARARLEQELEEVQSKQNRPAEEVESEQILDAEEVRESGNSAANLSLFQDELLDGSRGPQMVVIPPGHFRMGDLHGQGDDNEYPVHEVNIQHRFALARYEVTFAEYDRFAAATGRQKPDDEGWGRGQYPVINVTWEDAAAYARWLAEQTGQPYRLPTEAEWEYSARAGSQSVYWWGDEMLKGYVICDGCGDEWGGKSSAPVGSARANPWGLQDMNGNVDEWVLDCYQPDYSNAPDDGSAAQVSGCSQRVMRGGSWFDIPRLTRPSSRYRHPANSSRDSWGFRVALDLESPKSP